MAELAEQRLAKRPSTELRIVSLLPSATEMVCALGLADQLVGITHECDYPPQVKGKPVVVRNTLALDGLSMSEIDAAVSECIGSGASLYRVDERLMRELEPDLILTQGLCEVCAPSGNDIAQVVKTLPKKPTILSLTPNSLAGIEENLRDLGKATGRTREAELVIATGKANLEQVAAIACTIGIRPRVFCMEWTEPVFCSGHWVPEMVELAGGVDSLSRKGTDSIRVAWQDVLDWAPEVLVISPCGFNLEGASRQAATLFSRPDWDSLPAVRNKCVYAVDANSYFARPGPRVMEGVLLLAHLIHPEICEWSGPDDAFRLIC
jgi:iron complex transport system substrate-binding protein